MHSPRWWHRLVLFALALAPLLAASPTAQAYSHVRGYYGGRYYDTTRLVSPMPFRVNVTSILNWAATQPGDFWSRLALAANTLQTTIDAYEAWEQVPWATIEVNYDGGTSVTAPTQNGVNEVFFAANTSWAWWWTWNSGANVGRIDEGDIRLNTGVITAGRLGGEACQESGHIIGLDHSLVSNLFGANTDNASMSFGVNLNNDNVLSQDDIASVSTSYPVLRMHLTWSGWFPVFTFQWAHIEDFATVRGRVSTFLGLNRLNGAGVLAVNLSTGGAVVGSVSGTYNIPTAGLSGDLGTDGTGEYELPCLPPGTYAVVACPLLNYLPNTNRLQGNGFDAADMNQTFEPGARIVTVWAGLQCNGINLDGNSGDVNQDDQWTAADLTAFDAFVADPASYGWLIGGIVANLCDLNNDSSVNWLDRWMLTQLINQSNQAQVAGSVF